MYKTKAYIMIIENIYIHRSPQWGGLDWINGLSKLAQRSFYYDTINVKNMFNSTEKLYNTM